VQLARAEGASVVGTGRARHRAVAAELGVDHFVDLEHDRLEGVGEVDVVFDVIGGEIRDRSIPLVRAGGTLVTIVGPPTRQPAGGRAIFFVVEPDRHRLADLARRTSAGQLTPVVSAVHDLAQAPFLFAEPARSPGRPIIRL
jgi:NADPH:quinone reductase-like Zn-dependent oxidoreductase